VDAQKPSSPAANAPATSVVSAATSEGCSGVAERERREMYTQSVQQINPVGVKIKMRSPKRHVPERYVPNKRVADPDPNWILHSGQWIPIQEGKNNPQVKQIKKFHVLKCWMFSSES
jgi:hypothetical protein